MAGRPAAGRSGGSGLVYAVVAFAAISVLSLGGMIFSLANISAVQEEANRNRAQVQRFGTPPAYFAEEASARNSPVFAVMATDFGRLAELASGQKEAVLPAIEAQLRQLGSELAQRHGIRADQSLVATLGSLDRALTAASQSNAQLNQRVADLEAERDALTAGLRSANEEFSATAQELGEEVARAEKEKVEALETKDRQLADLRADSDAKSDEFSQTRTEFQRQSRERDIAEGRLRNDLTKLEREVQALRGDTFDPEAILKKADARVLKAIPGSDVIYVDLGTGSGVKRGMGFEVYSQQPDERESVRGKASVEVVTLGASVSECVVIRSSLDQPIIEGDLLVNIAFEDNAKPRFVVRGAFDLNYDGVVDDDSVARVSALIREWGGEVVSELDESVHYLVVGVAPVVPELPPGRRVTPLMQVQLERRAAQAQVFRDVVERAQARSIPVITQSQLLFLTGYSGDTSLRPR